MIHFDVYNERKHIIIGCIEEIEHIHHSSLGQDISWHHKEGGNDRQGMYNYKGECIHQQRNTGIYTQHAIRTNTK